MKYNFITHAWINGVLRQLSKSGVDLCELEAALPELDIRQIESSHRVSLTLARQIWHKAAELSQDPLLGYKVGNDINLKGMGVLAPILIHSPTQRQSLENIIQYSCLISDAFHIAMKEDTDGEGNEDFLIYEITPKVAPIKENSHHIVSMMASMGAMSHIMGVRKNAIHKLVVPDDLDLPLLSQHMRQHLEPTADSTYRMYYRKTDMESPIIGCDNHLYQVNKAYADDLIQQKKAGDDLVESIKSLIIQHGYQKANVDRVTEQLGISKRSLQRSLAEEKTSFRSLKEEVVKDRALYLIVRGDTSIDNISQELGYSEVSAFHRAFKIWFGITPKDYADNPSLPL